MPRQQRIFDTKDLAIIQAASIAKSITVHIVGPNFTQEQVNYYNDVLAGLRKEGYIITSGKIASVSKFDIKGKFTVICDNEVDAKIYIFQ